MFYSQYQLSRIVHRGEADLTDSFGNNTNYL